jgi:hypothetical protein
VGYLGGGSDLIDGLGAVGGGLDDASAVSDFEAAAAAESICDEEKPGDGAKSGYAGSRQLELGI